MGIGENEHFFVLSSLHQGITLLDQRLSAVWSQRLQAVESDDEFREVAEQDGPLDLRKLSTMLSEGNASPASMKAVRELLVSCAVNSCKKL